MFYCLKSDVDTLVPLRLPPPPSPLTDEETEAMTESDWPKPVQLSKTIPGPACEGPECMLRALGIRSGTELGDSVAAQHGSINNILLCARLFPRSFTTFP